MPKSNLRSTASLDGVIVSRRFLPGELHTVRPIALAALPVFTRNCREYTVMDTKNFGRLAQIEVGAMLVGRVENYKGAGVTFRRGEEKGFFEYGGSTVLLLLGAGAAQIREDILRASKDGRETPVRLGERIGIARK